MKKKKVDSFTDAEMELIRQKRREYLKRWKENNPGKSKLYQNRYWLKKAQQESGQTDNWFINGAVEWKKIMFGSGKLYQIFWIILKILNWLQSWVWKD